MLDHFLSAAYSHERENKEKRSTVDALKKLPAPFLAKLASGEVKLGFMDECTAPDSASHPWLDKFKGTPLAEQAMQLEEQMLQLEVQDMQERQQSRQENAARDSIWDQRDQLRIQKKLLELQLYQLVMQEEHAAMAPPPTVDTQKKKAVPEAGTPGAGSMGPEAENSEENMAPVGTRGPGDAKTAKVREVLNFKKFFAENPKKTHAAAGLTGISLGGAAQHKIDKHYDDKGLKRRRRRLLR